MRRVDQARREGLEARLQQLELQAHARPVQRRPEERPGCLGQWFGR